MTNFKYRKIKKGKIKFKFNRSIDFAMFQSEDIISNLKKKRSRQLSSNYELDKKKAIQSKIYKYTFGCVTQFLFCSYEINNS